MNKIEIMMFVVGFQFHHIQRLFGMRNLADGVHYYGEVHLSCWNSLIHTAFMPFTMLGMYLWVPAIFGLNPERAVALKWKAMLFYIGLYSRISVLHTAAIVGVYYCPYLYSTALYSCLYKYGYFNVLLIDDYYLQKMTVLNRANKCFMYGVGISFTSLFIQETLGHYIGGDAPSRIEAVPNAVLYAVYYSVSHLLGAPK